MKILITYYSRTKTTKKVAEILAQKLDADIEEIIDTKNRDGITGYMSAGRDGMKERVTKIKPTEKEPAAYDLVIVGTPIWAWNISSPVRTYLEEHKKNIPEFALLITQGAKPPKQVEIFQKMEELIGREAIAKLHLSTAQVKKNDIDREVEDFIKALHV